MSDCRVEKLKNKNMKKDKKHFVILSNGAYSDYSPIYFMGDIPITQEELDRKGREIGDYLIAQYEALPERPTTAFWDDRKMEKYDPVTNETIYSLSYEEWFPLMKKWLLEEMGYEELPSDIPEINIHYDIPHS